VLQAPMKFVNLKMWLAFNFDSVWFCRVRLLTKSRWKHRGNCILSLHTSKLHAQIAYYYHTYLQLFFPPYHIFPYIGNNNYPLLSCQCEVWNSDRSYDLGRISKHYENDIVCCLGLWLWSSYVLGIAMKIQSLSF
jgi:hypothetical protein